MKFIDKIFALPNAAQGSTQDVYQTLFMASHPTKERTSRYHYQMTEPLPLGNIFI
jgi:hypothetical protein